MKSLKIGGTDLQGKTLKLKYIVWSMLLLVSSVVSSRAADISAIDFNGNLLGKVIPDGSVIDFDNELIGHITADGYTVNDENVLIGGIVPQGIAVSSNYGVLGKVNNDGSVTSENDELIGKVLPNGLVVNDNYDVLGAVISPGLVYNDKGKIVGRVSGDGNFYNLSGERQGFVTDSGYVYAPAGSEREIALVGKLMTSKMVVDSSGRFLGSITPDGKVIDLQKNIIGNVHANGFVYNADKKIIGHIVEAGYAFDFNGTYLGVVSYNGEIIDKGKSVGYAVWGNRVINKDGNQIGFTVSRSATVNNANGQYLGLVVADGNVVKGSANVGRVGASGSIIDNQGTVIGTINISGPIFDYLGNLKANASAGGRVMSLDGADLGYMQSQSAFDRKDKEIGRILDNHLAYTNNNKFLDISGINSFLSVGGENYKISPYGYVFDDKGEISGRSYLSTNIISDEGNILTYTSEQGATEKSSLNEIAQLTGAGILIDKNNKLLGSKIASNYASDFYGNTLGNINPTNLVINNQNQTSGRVMPNNEILSMTGNPKQTLGSSGNAIFGLGINGDYLGVVLTNSQIKKTGEIVGKLSSDNLVLDNAGALYGAGISTGVAVTDECKYLGIVSDNGDIRNFNGIRVGTMLANNQVINDVGEVIGHIINPQAVIGDKGEVLGVENALGSVLNYDNRNLGCQDSLGQIKNSQSEIVGQIIPKSPVMDYNNSIIGKVNFSGNVINASEQQFAYIGLDGGIHTPDGDNIAVLFNYKVAFDENNTYLGRISPKGEVVSDGGEILGQVGYNGYVTLQDGRAGYALNDLYVYDDNEKTAGYIAKNGSVYNISGDLIGNIYQGFVLDKKQKVVARGKRDYLIRNDEKNIIGYLKLNGEVINYKNIIVGQLSENGEVLDSSGNVIGEADPLQYYHKLQNKVEQPEEIEDSTAAQSVITQPVVTQPVEKQDDNADVENNDLVNNPVNNEENLEDRNPIDTSKIQEVNNTAVKHKIVGIAITPGGKYIGDVYSNNDVIDSNGNIVGSKDKDGQIIDTSGKIIGDFKEKNNERNKAADRNWWKSIVDGVTASPYNTNNEAVNVGPGGGIGPGGRYNPRRAEIIAQLHNSRRQTMSKKSISNDYDAVGYTGWQDSWENIGIGRSISSLRVDMSNMITADKPIPAVMARSLISLGGAPITAIVERNVYGDTGRNVIIPAGSRVIGGIGDGGELDSNSRFDGTSGGVKLKIEWQRIVRPDGITFILANSSQTGDAQGRGGGALGYVDEQMVKKYTMPLVGTIATSAITYMMAADQDATGEVETSKQQAASDARQQFMEKMNDILDEIIENKSEIEAVTFIPAGTRIIIYPMADLWLRSTKEIEKNEEGSLGKRHKDVLIDDDGNSQTTVETNNTQQGTSNNQVPVNNNQQNTRPLIDDRATQQQQQQNVPGAIPPPAADGTVAEFPGDNEDETGDIVLF